MQPYTPPGYEVRAFHCPHCQAYAEHLWCPGFGKLATEGRPFRENDLEFTICSHCKRRTVWYKKTMVYPGASTAPHPNPDLPQDILDDYEEARSILSHSTRGASALFRLCIQKLCRYLGETEKTLNADIASLVNKGLNPRIQKSLDIVRVVGNEAVHPGTIDLKDDPDTAVKLATLINIITDATISQPKAIEELYGKIPDEKKAQIEKRDA